MELSVILILLLVVIFFISKDGSTEKTYFDSDHVKLGDG